MGKNEGIPTIDKSRELTKKEFLESLRNNLAAFSARLQETSDSEQRQTLLHNIGDRLATIEQTTELADCINFAKELVGQIDLVLCYEATIDSVNELLRSFLEFLDSLIAKEKKKENSSKVAALLRELAGLIENGKVDIDLSKYFA